MKAEGNAPGSDLSTKIDLRILIWRKQAQIDGE